ncbi:MAG: hypothetical protein H6Q75_599 [Firmicutes bacterium]|nr:hypothetical protein [Bacillota bacterium]
MKAIAIRRVPLVVVVLAGVLMMTMAAVSASPKAVAEVANELYGRPKTEVQRELNPDRVTPKPSGFNGTLASVPGIHLP